jgi:hypothetical protein
MFQDTLEIAKRKYSELKLDKRDKGWFAHWSILQEIDGEGLKTTLIRNREFALRGIQELGFVPPDSVNSAISDLRSARRLTQALRQWKTNRKPDFGERVLIGFFLQILSDWCELIDPTAGRWESNAALVRILGTGASLAFITFDLERISAYASADAELEERELADERRRPKRVQAGKASAEERRRKREPRLKEYLARHSKKPVAEAARAMGVAPSTIYRWKKNARDRLSPK